MDVVGAEDDVDLRRPSADDLAVLLGQAAGDDDLAAPVAAASFQRLSWPRFP